MEFYSRANAPTGSAGEESVSSCWVAAGGPLRIGNDVTFLMQITDDIHFAWQVQYLVRLEGDFSWQAQHL